tara:strand:+ start:4857 stop:4967 length:111 start_codon:yes stop_codon:yes gene_type:complete
LINEILLEVTKHAPTVLERINVKVTALNNGDINGVD